jgi:hypothetical protein
VQLLEKVHRYADRLAARLNTAPCPRAVLPASTAEAVVDLGVVADWCDSLVPTAASA